MNEKEFLEWCKQEVCDYTNKHLDKTDKKEVTTDDVFMVWSCKTLQNNKAEKSTQTVKIPPERRSTQTGKALVEMAGWIPPLSRSRTCTLALRF